MAQLLVENGPQAGTALLLERDQPVTVGTGEDCELRLRDAAVARHHAVIKALKGAGFGVKRLGPGLRVNGGEVEAARLDEGDVLELGNTRIRYRTAARQAALPQLGGFRLLEELGRGGMGVVYRAEQISLNRQVAVKVLSKELTEDPVFVARFVAEARAAARLHHPNVVQVFDVDHEGDTYFYSMELLHEGSLEDRLRMRGKLSVEEAIQAVADAASGLSYAESLRLVHRDIKPDNLMLDQHGTVKVSDLGLAMSEEDSGDKVLGTPHFMSPEQVLRKPLDHRSDLYALGCTFHRLITGDTPFSGSTVKEILRAHVKQDPEPAHKLDPDVPQEVSAIILKLMAKDPADRYQGAEELLDELRELMAPPSRRLLVVGSIILAMLVAGAAIAFALTRENGETREIVRYRDNPEAQRLARELDEANGEVARLRTQHSGLEGVALADALEEIAAAHPDTDAATAARAAASIIRADVERETAAIAARAEALSAALERMREQVREAIAADDYRAASAALATDALPEYMRQSAALSAGVEQIRDELRGAVQRGLLAMRRDVDQARIDGDPDALAAGVGRFDTVLDPDAGWPADLIPDRAQLIAQLASWRGEVASLRVERERVTLEAGWLTYGAGITEMGDALQKLDLQAAAARATALAAELEQHPGGGRAEQFAAAVSVAEASLQRFEAAVIAGGVTFAWEEGDVPVLGFQRDGPEAGLTLNLGRRSRPRPHLVPGDELRTEQWQELIGITEAPADPWAFLAVEALADHIREARAYLGRIEPDRDASGTGEEGYPLDTAFLEELVARMGQEPWAGFIARELRAAIRLASGLRAMSDNRSRAGAAHLERLLQEFPRSLLVQALL